MSPEGMQGLAAVINSKSEYPPPNQCACRLLPTWALMTLTMSDRHCQDKLNRRVCACAYAWMCVCVSYRQKGWDCFHAMHTHPSHVVIQPLLSSSPASPTALCATGNLGLGIATLPQNRPLKPHSSHESSWI